MEHFVSKAWPSDNFLASLKASSCLGVLVVGSQCCEFGYRRSLASKNRLSC